MKILINTPRVYERGGVANFYLDHKDYCQEKVQYHTIGTRSVFSIQVPGIVLLPFDIILFVFRLLIWNPDIVLLNPSLNYKAVRRDFFYLKIARLFRRKIVVFFHGWYKEYEQTLDTEKFASILNTCSAIFVLASTFKNKLLQWQVSIPIYLFTTKISDKLLENFDISKKNYTELKLLFMARIEKGKGIYLALDFMKQVNVLYPNLSLTIAGDGSELNNVKKTVETENIKNVIFLGNVEGEDKIKVFTETNLYIFPSHHEGMPISVLESMAFGLPILTTKVGGLPDFFKENEMGYFCKYDVNDFISYLTKFIEHPELLKTIGNYNHQYAKTNFLASMVAKKMENLFTIVHNSK